MPADQATLVGGDSHSSPDAVVECLAKTFQYEAERRLLEAETDRFRQNAEAVARAGSFWQRLSEAPRDSFQPLLNRIANAMDAVAIAITASNRDAGAKVERLRQEWIDSRQRLRTTRAETAASRKAVSTTAWELAAFGVAGLAWLLWTLAAALARRHAWRRVRGGAITGACAWMLLPGLLIAGGMTFLDTSDLWPRLLSQFTSPSNSAANIVVASPEEPLAEMEHERAAKHDELLQAQAAFETAQRQWQHAVAARLHDDDSLSRAWLDVRRRLREAEVTTAVIPPLAEELEKSSRRLAEATQELNQVKIARLAAEHSRAQRLLIVMALLAALLALAWLALGVRHWRKRQRDSRVCIKCQNVDTLKSVPIPKGGSADFRESQCAARWNENEPCGFRIAERYRSDPRVCFPTVGLPTTGKTHWLAVTYDRLKRENYPSGLAFQRIETKAMQHLETDVLSHLYGGRRTLSATSEGLPDPLIFGVRPGDWIGPSEVLLSLFDYSGEVMRMRRTDDPLRQRMLRADGLLLFLDPNIDPTAQLNEMDRFLADARLGRLRAPAAVCITKIDTLKRGATSRDPVAVFLDELQRMAGNRKLSGIGRRAIELRSKTTRRLIRGLWSGTDFSKRFRRAFGNNYRFFPISSTGFGAEGEPGDPQFVLEPLFWLLERNGYPMLSARQVSRERD